MRRASVLVSISITIAALAPGCARGSGDEPGTDAGHPRDGGQADSGLPIGMDSGSPIGTDSGPLGADSGPLGADSGPLGCTSALDCSDGRACNGTERCEGGSCVPGTAILCDDGIACTTDSCVEPGTCAYTTVDSMCPAGQRCTATGCTSSTGTCTESPCRLVSPQCGCATGQACYLSGATRVCAVAGAGAEGAGCTGSANCGAGLDCINFSTVATTSATQCARYCASDSDCVGTGSLCIQELGDGSGGTIAGVRICSRACNPVRQTGCASGLMCNIYQEAAGAMRFLTDCTGPIGTGVSYDFCTVDSDCAAGYACISSMCLHWCNVTTDEGCSGLELCSPLTPSVVLGGVEHGVCT